MAGELSRTDRQYLDNFSKAICSGIESIVEAARVYVDAIDSNPHLVDVFRD